MMERFAYRYDRLTPAGKRLARIPRFARLIAVMPEAVLDRIQSDASAYWNLFSFIAPQLDGETGLIDSGLNTAVSSLLGWRKGEPEIDRTNLDTRRWQCRLAMDMLGAIAFEMFCRKLPDNGPSFQIVDDIAGFRKAACKRLADSGAYVNELDEPMSAMEFLRTDWPRLQHMNSHGLEHAILSSFGGRTVGSGNVKQRLFFADVSAQAFFAAYWALRWSNEGNDLRQMGQWIPDPISMENSGYQEFWKMILEMPPEAIKQCDTDPMIESRFQQLCAPFFDIDLQSDHQRPIRSTDLMYAMRERMESSAAMAAFRSEFCNRHSNNPVARSIFVDETGTSPVSQFVRLGDPASPVDEKDTGRFFMGDIDERLLEKSVAPFWLNRYCLTNLQYECFDPRHHDHRAFVDEVNGGVNDHPVVQVSWYDAYWFAEWMGTVEIGGQTFRVCLPTQEQWEYGCRCGETTAFTWSSRNNGDRIRSGDCNFEGNLPWPEYGFKSKDGLYLRRTISVNGFDEELLVPPNPWGLHQMHGNVWEWCESGNYVARRRVLRGGSWFNLGRFCRSGYRDARDPSRRSWDSGFRVAAVPEPSQADRQASSGARGNVGSEGR